MKKIVLGIAVVASLFASCDKVRNPMPDQAPQGSYALYPNGDSAHYAANAWPTFTENTNTNRNVLIEDYTGHFCKYCPLAAAGAESIKDANPGRVVVMGIHAGPLGTGTLQVVSADYPTVFYNSITDELGNYFGVDWPGSLFIGNPYGSVSRKDNGNGTPMEGPQTWSNSTNVILTANDLKVNLQAASNYYSSTKGLFLHTEVDVIDQALTNELRIVAYLVENELVAPQLMPDDSRNPTYVHHDILRASLDGTTFGQELDAAHLDANGKYYFNYIYEMPAGYNNTNSHVVIFVRDAVTEEVYQVIKHEF